MSDDMDLDIDDDFGDEEAPQKASFKDMWDNNPFLKIGAVVIIVVFAGFLYSMAFSGDDDDPSQDSMLRDKGGVRGEVGGAGASEEYKKALEEKNQQNAEYARMTGDSAVPTPIGRQTGLMKPDDSSGEEAVAIDPLQEWRKTAEAQRFQIDFAETPEEIETSPEIAPIVAPIRPQTEVLQDPEMASRLAGQMQLILASKAPVAAERVSVTAVTSAYTLKVEQDEAATGASRAGGLSSSAIADGGTVVFDGSNAGTAADISGDGSSSDMLAENSPVLIPGGEVVYAQLLTELNSDVPGPALAHVLSGPLKGGRAIGSFSMQDEYLTITFNRIVKDDITYEVNTIALDPDTTLNGLSSDVDKHYFTRVILPAAAEFISGFGEAVTQTDTTAVASDGSTVSSTADLDIEQEIAKGAAEAFDKVSELTEDGADRPITVKVYQGTPMGLLFLETVREDDGE